MSSPSNPLPSQSLVLCYYNSSTATWVPWSGSGSAANPGEIPSLENVFAVYVLNQGNFVPWDGNFTQTSKSVVNGSVSGTAYFSQPQQEPLCKKVIIYCANLTGTASYTFPTSFVGTPVIVNTTGLPNSIITNLSNTSCTVTGTDITGFLIIEGY